MTAFNVITGIATFAGLCFSILAWREAKSASIAAQEARAAVLIRTLADALNDAVVLINRIVHLARMNRFDEISDVAYEVNGLLSETAFRMKDRLEEPSVNDLLTARTQLQLISERLLPNNAPFGDDDKQQLVRISQHTSAKIREMIGTIKNRLDRGE